MNLPIHGCSWGSFPKFFQDVYQIRLSEIAWHFLVASLPLGQYKPDGSIRINVSETNPLANARVLAHELGHALLHKEAEYRGHKKAGLKELEADSVAYCVLQHYGLDSGESSFGYIAGWNRNSEKAIAQLQESGSRIMKATHQIVEWIESKSIQQ